jgi:hypothetical protein
MNQYKTLVILFFILLTSTAMCAWKEKKDHYEFTFEWTKDGWWSNLPKCP